jgi:HD-GYP domain-containing protein (c-di-GMP phosphodiesterase class II)
MHLGNQTKIKLKNGLIGVEEYVKIRMHPAKGARILEPLEYLRAVIPLIEQHHERFDRMGYPYGLAGNEIDPGARIIAVADVFDALRMDRPYRSGVPLEKVVALIKDGAGTQFDPDVVAAFLQFIAPMVRTQPKSREDRLSIQPSKNFDKPVETAIVPT